MEFEFDKNKSFINKEKHGIDFEEAQKLGMTLIELKSLQSMLMRREMF